jgi:hypothetical protein
MCTCSGGALHLLEQVGVEQHLQQRAALRLARELRVHDLVRPRAERARPLDALEEVRVAEPRAVEERALIHDIGAGTQP